MKDCLIYLEDNKLLSVFYYESDHLGSASYVTNKYGKVTQTLNYLPYGEDWVDLQNFSEMPAENNLGVYQFNGKEKDDETGYNYYGARYYDSEKIGWLSVDPMSDKYPSLSPYVYCADNPVKLIDPNGKDIWVNADDGSQTQYKYGLKYEGKDKFTRETFMALDKDHEHKESGDKIDYLANKSQNNITIHRGSETFLDYGAKIKYEYDENKNLVIKLSGSISFNPNRGLQDYKDKSQVLSPATALFHELGHIIDLMIVDIKTGKNFTERRNTENFMYGDDEEMYNIENNEHPLAKYKGEYLRETHSRSKLVNTESSISTKIIIR